MLAAFWFGGLVVTVVKLIVEWQRSSPDVSLLAYYLRVMQV